MEQSVVAKLSELEGERFKITGPASVITRHRPDNGGENTTIGVTFIGMNYTGQVVFDGCAPLKDAKIQILEGTIKYRLNRDVDTNEPKVSKAGQPAMTIYVTVNQYEKVAALDEALLTGQAPATVREEIGST